MPKRCNIFLLKVFSWLEYDRSLNSILNSLTVALFCSLNFVLFYRKGLKPCLKNLCENNFSKRFILRFTATLLIFRFSREKYSTFLVMSKYNLMVWTIHIHLKSYGKKRRCGTGIFPNHFTNLMKFHFMPFHWISCPNSYMHQI